MNNISTITPKIASLRAETQEASITPERIGSLLQQLANLIADCATDTQLNAVQGTSSGAATKEEFNNLKNAALVNVTGRTTRDANSVNIILTLTEGDDDTSTVTISLPVATATAAGIITAADYKKVSDAIANIGSSSSSSSSGITDAERTKLNNLSANAACFSNASFTAGESDKKKKYKIWLTLRQISGESSAEYDVDIPIATTETMGVMSTEQVELLNKSMKDVSLFIEEASDDYINLEIGGTDNLGKSGSIGRQLKILAATEEYAGLLESYNKTKLEKLIASNVYDLGTFTTSGQAESRAATVAISGDRAKGILTYTVSGSSVNGTGVIIQRVEGLQTEQRLYWNGSAFKRTITFNNTSHDAVSSTSSWTSIGSYTKQGIMTNRTLKFPDYITGLFHYYQLPIGTDDTLGTVYLRSQRVETDGLMDDSTYECDYINRLEDRIAALEARLNS